MRNTVKNEKKGTTKEEEDGWAGPIVNDEGKGNGMSTEIHFEISAERCGNGGHGDHEKMPSKMSGVVRAVTSDRARWALGTVIDVFLTKRMNGEDKGR
ncbi:MAG: hypothetical protein LBI08_04150 [Methanomassiliicoccaceae archaeon]|jgi:hypothetical protein|nr:hypothetical protein [Methanomassiliicoccaceae archaeon]